MVQIGSIVMLKGSRKAPNNTPLKVLDVFNCFWDKQGRKHKIPESMLVSDEQGNKYKCSTSCIDRID